MTGGPLKAERLASVLERTADSLFVLDRDGRVVHATDRTCATLGCTRDQLVGEPLWEFVDSVASQDFERFWAAATQPDGLDMELVHRYLDGGVRPVRVRAHVDGSAEPPLLVAQAWSIRSHERLIEDLTRSEQRLNALLQAIPDMLFRLDSDGTILDFKAADQSQLAVPADQIIGRKMMELPLPADVRERGWTTILKAIETGERQQYEYRLEVPAGPRDFECRVVPSAAEECVCVVRDVTDRVTAQAEVVAQLEHLSEESTHDRLTGLLDRDAIRAELGRAICDASEDGSSVAVLFVDLDRFKQVNDRLGHATGDLVLRDAAASLRDSVRSSDAVGRVGGDEFVVIIRNVNGESQARTTAHKLAERLTRRIDSPVGPIELGASVGVAIYPRDGLATEQVLNAADRAMYTAKRGRDKP
jgi:diguanylate cyclase (GGDEF)-like protein/PAS domain S-box-containing protein